MFWNLQYLKMNSTSLQVNEWEKIHVLEIVCLIRQLLVQICTELRCMNFIFHRNLLIENFDPGCSPNLSGSTQRKIGQYWHPSLFRWKLMDIHSLYGLVAVLKSELSKKWFPSSVILLIRLSSDPTWIQLMKQNFFKSLILNTNQGGIPMFWSHCQDYP